MGDTMPEKFKGLAKEAAGRVVDDDELEEAGRQQQEKAQRTEEAERLEREAAEKRSEAAAKEREQRRRGS